jgi:hypothetical protein
MKNDQMKQKATEYLKKQGLEIEKVRKEYEDSHKRLAESWARIGAAKEIGSFVPIGPDLYGHTVAAVQQIVATFKVTAPGGDPPRWNEGELATLEATVTNGSRFIMHEVVLAVSSKNPAAASLWDFWWGFSGNPRYLGTMNPGETRRVQFFAIARQDGEGQTASFGATITAEPDLLVRAAEQVGGSTPIVGN